MLSKLFSKKTRVPKLAAGQFLVRVAKKRLLAADICEFVLTSPDETPLPEWDAGAHIDIHLPTVGIRQYSLAGDPRDRSHYTTAVLRETQGRGGSAYLCDVVKEGDLLAIGEPRNHFPLHANARFHLLVAGGIGVTPLLSMAYQLTHQGAPFKLLYRARSAAVAAYAQELLSEMPFAGQVECFFSDQGGREAFDIEARVQALPEAAHVYVCGPNTFIESIRAIAVPVLGENSVHSEAFHAENVSSFEDARNATVEVRCVRSKVTVMVDSEQSILDALAAQGVDIPKSCEEGVCGSCITQVLEGEIDHRDAVLTKKDREHKKLFTPCCSRAKSASITLDV